MRRAVVAAAVAVLLLAGCSDKVDLPASVTAAPPTAGCVSTPTEELFVASLWDCQDTMVYLFASKGSRDSWRRAAEEFGAVVVGEGDTWLQVKS